MPRKTRAAAKAQDPVFAETPEEVPLPRTPKRDNEREPLRSITPNSVDGFDNDGNASEDMAKPKGKKGKKGGAKKKGKKAQAEKIEEEQPESMDESNQDAPEALEDENAVGSSQGLDIGVEEPKEDAQEAESDLLQNDQPTSKAQRKTRRQIAKEEAEAAAAAQADEMLPEPKAKPEELSAIRPEPEAEPKEDESPVVEEAHVVEEEESTAVATQELPDRTLSKPEPLTLVKSNASSRPAEPEDPIEAIDALEDAIDEVGKIMPSLDSPTLPVKPKKPAKAKAEPIISSKAATANAKAPLGRTASVRAGAPKITATTQPSATSRVKALAEPKKSAVVSALSPSTSTRTRPASVIVPKKQEGEAKNARAVADKRRPISIHFPTPPPTLKSKKAPTTASFTLPGEAVAAKLKAARLERQKREEEEAAKKRDFKARPVPNTKPKPTEIKQTTASRARQSIIGLGQENPEAGGLKRSSTVTGATTASKCNSVSATKRSSMIGAPKPTTTAANTAQKRSSLIVSKPVSKTRAAPTTVTAKERVPSAGISRSVSGSDAVAQRMKGKEVFNRDKVFQETREKERRDKDEAIKKARAEAAERGRQASREWAEKQKRALEQKKMKSSTSSETGASASPVAEAAPVAV